MRLRGTFNCRHLLALAWRGLPVLDGLHREAPIHQRVKRAKECFHVARMSDQRGAADGILLHMLMDLYILEEVSPIHVERSDKFNPEMITRFRHALPFDSGLLESRESASAYA
jgi:hypothetical protein